MNATAPIPSTGPIDLISVFICGFKGDETVSDQLKQIAPDRALDDRIVELLNERAALPANRYRQKRRQIPA